MDIIISLLGEDVNVQRLFMNKKGETLFGKLRKHDSLSNKAILSISWPDRGVPTFGGEFWDDLVDILDKESVKRPINVLFFCMGGHGRTGSALSIMCSLMDLSVGDPIQWVRDNYCREAVESVAQKTYIEEVTGVKSHVTFESKWAGYYKGWNL